MSEELKPCPFCGDKAVYLCSDTVGDCSKCWLDELTIKQWNTRPIEDELREEIFKITEIGVKHQVNLREFRAENERLKKTLKASEHISFDEHLVYEASALKAKLEKAKGIVDEFIKNIRKNSRYHPLTNSYGVQANDLVALETSLKELGE